MTLESRDILNYSLAIAVIVLTVLFSWILVYIIKIFRQVEHIFTDVTKAIEKFTGVLDYVKEKVSSTAALIPIFVQGSEKIVEMVNSFREKRSKRTKEEASRGGRSQK